MSRVGSPTCEHGHPTNEHVEGQEGEQAPRPAQEEERVGDVDGRGGRLLPLRPVRVAGVRERVQLVVGEGRAVQLGAVRAVELLHERAKEHGGHRHHDAVGGREHGRDDHQRLVGARAVPEEVERGDLRPLPRSAHAQLVEPPEAPRQAEPILRAGSASRLVAAAVATRRVRVVSRPRVAFIIPAAVCSTAEQRRWLRPWAEQRGLLVLLVVGAAD
eukprot:scaffold20159_cov55-Phaeocystis_antarctica.AAC.2